MEKFDPKDTLFVFLGQDFLFLDYKMDTWAYGDSLTAYGTLLEIGENCSILKLTP